MNRIIQIFPYNYQNDLIANYAHEIRRKVFVIEQSVAAHLEFDEFETCCQHYLAYYENRAAGTARWRQTSEGIKLERIAVLPAFRSRGIGAAILKHLIEEVKRYFKPIYVTAPLAVCGWFEKQGFVIVGNEFIEAGIPHRKLVLPGWPPAV